MTEIQAFLLGLLQGLTEFIPVSSSGHVELGNYLFHNSSGENLNFTITVHVATVLSTLVVFRIEIFGLLRNGLSFRNKEETIYIGKLLFSAIPVAFLGLFFKDEIKSLFDGNLIVVGTCLLITATLLIFAHFYRGKQLHKIGWTHALIIGLAQAVAILPGLSRSGATISTGILLGNNRKEVARFSFLMVILPVIGAAAVDFLTLKHKGEISIGIMPLTIGFISAFISGWFACKWMISIVSKGKLIYFAIYCIFVGLFAIFAA